MQTTLIFNRQDMPHVDLTKSAHYDRFLSVGWGLRTRKYTNPISENVKSSIERL